MTTGYVLYMAKALRNKMTADSGITNLVGGTGSSARIGPYGAAQYAAYPYILYSLPISDQPVHGIGFNGPASNVVRLQVDCYAATWTACAGLQNEIYECLEGATLTVTGAGTPRLEGEGSTIVDEEVTEGVRVFRGISRYKAVLAGVSVS